ncbi:MAG: TIGR04002 family protein [Oscillospiraceae bacterium]|nr:TIGR04002 family protein [Oscillospiraceae bacterium]
MNSNLKKIVLSAVFAALIIVTTAYVKIPIGINEGYIHLGDSIIYLAGCLLGPFAAIAAAIGGAIADILAGAAMWAPGTAVIKALISVPFIIATAFYNKKNVNNRIIHLSTILVTLLSGAITVLGYWLYEGFLYSFASAFASMPFNAIQAVGSAVVFIILGCALDAVKIQKLLK